MQHPSSFGTHYIDLWIPDRLTVSEPAVQRYYFSVSQIVSAPVQPLVPDVRLSRIARSLSASGQSQSFCGVFALYDQDRINVWHMFGTGAEA